MKLVDIVKAGIISGTLGLGALKGQVTITADLFTTSGLESKPVQGISIDSSGNINAAASSTTFVYNSGLSSQTSSFSNGGSTTDWATNFVDPTLSLYSDGANIKSWSTTLGSSGSFNGGTSPTAAGVINLNGTTTAVYTDGSDFKTHNYTTLDNLTAFNLGLTPSGSYIQQRTGAVDTSANSYIVASITSDGHFSFNSLAGSTLGNSSGYFIDGSGTYTFTDIAFDLGNNKVYFGGFDTGGNGFLAGANLNMDFAAVPEPSTYALIGGGAALLAAFYRRRKRFKDAEMVESEGLSPSTKRMLQSGKDSFTKYK